MQLALRAERVDDAIGDDRHGARSFVEAEVVAVVRGVRVAPDRCAGLGVERLEHFLVADAVEEQHAVLDDRGPGECLTDLLAPDDLRAGRAPRLGQWRAGVGAVAIRSEKLRPVGGDDRHTAASAISSGERQRDVACRRLYRNWTGPGSSATCEDTPHVDRADPAEGWLRAHARPRHRQLPPGRRPHRGDEDHRRSGRACASSMRR